MASLFDGMTLRLSVDKPKPDTIARPLGESDGVLRPTGNVGRRVFF